MSYSTTIAELQRAGIAFRSSEAVAIAQQLINESGQSAPHAPFGPPSIDNVGIDELGVVTCTACAVKPAVSEIAILLDAMLPAGTRVPGGLRYTIARALLNVDAPPFDSVEELSAVLSRFERGHRGTVIRELIARARAMPDGTAPAAIIPFKQLSAPVRFKTERRQGLPAVVAAELRRELRKADLERYARQASATLPDLRGALHQHRRPIGAVGAGLAAGLLLIASGEMMHSDAGAAADLSMPTPFIAAPARRMPEPAASYRLPADFFDSVSSHSSAGRTPVPDRVSSRSRASSSTLERGGRSPRASVGEEGAPRSRMLQTGGRDRGNRRTPSKSVLARFGLQWVRTIFTFRRDL